MAWQGISVRAVLWLAISGLGVSAFLTQVVLLRELMAALGGNELVLGIVLGSWMLLTGLGASAGRVAQRLRQPLAGLAWAQMVLAVLPLGQIWIIRACRDWVFPRGAEVGPAETVLVGLTILAPYCLLAGFLLTLTCRLLAPDERPESIGQVYFLDVLGDIAGGLLFSFVLVWLWGHFGTLYLPAFLNLLLAGALGYLVRSRPVLAMAGLLTAVLALGAATVDWELASTRRQFAGQEVLFQGQSPYNRVVITRLGEQVTFYANGTPLFSTGDPAAIEQKVHFAMAQRPQARRVLVLGGGLSAAAGEVLRWAGLGPDQLPPDAPPGQSPPTESIQVDYVELDPLLVSAGQQWIPPTRNASAIRVVTADGRLWVRSSSERYDVVLADVPDPVSIQWNRFYSREFFLEVKQRLTADGVFSLACASYENYLSPELADLVAIVHRTLREAFQKVLMIPADRIIFLASDGPLTTQIAERIAQHGLKTHSMRPGHLAGILAEDRLVALQRAIRPDAPINRDFFPILAYRHLRYWMRQFQVRWGVFLAALAVLGLWCLWRARPVTVAVFSAGLAGALLHVVLLLGFQVVFGCVYHRVGLMVTAFMAGLAVGAAWMNRRLGRWSGGALAAVVGALAAFAALLPAVLAGLDQASRWPGLNLICQVAFLTLAFGLAVLVGMVFPLAAKMAFEQVSITAGRIYTADYLGAAFGALLGSSLLIPLWGIGPVCGLTAALNLAAAGILLMRKM
jgi:spermidine synthase